MSVDSYIYRAERINEAAPLIFAFHGTGGNEDQFVDLAKQLFPDAGIIGPRGDVSEHGALRYFRRTGEGVYDMDDLLARTEKMTAFVRSQVARIKPSKTIAFGYSNGANILASMMFRHADLFDAAALMHPLIPWEPRDNAGLAGKPILITAGRRDPICPPPLTLALNDYFLRQHSKTGLVWHDGGHEIQQNEIAALATFSKEVIPAALNEGAGS